MSVTLFQMHELSRNLWSMLLSWESHMGQKQLKAAIEIQPISVGVEADTSFQLYDSGILNDDLCGADLDHAVTAVGYGIENGVEYYLVRNSWGSSWGENGYIRILAGFDGLGICGILEDSLYPETN